MSLHSLFELVSIEREDEPPYFSLLRERSFDEAIPLIREAMARDDGQAMGFYATLLALGRGVERNTPEAAAWFRQGAVRGDIFSKLAFGVCLASGLGLQTDHMEAAYWLYQAARAGQPVAISVLSDVVGRNPGVVGRHFSIEEYHDLMTKLRRPDAVH